MNITISFDTTRLINKYKERRLVLYPRAATIYVHDMSSVAKSRFIMESSHKKYIIGRGRQTMSDTIGSSRKVRVAPYSKRLPKDSGPTRDFQINIQSGEYNAGWYDTDATCPGFGSHAVAMAIGNRAPHAKYLHTIGGTGWMRERPIVSVVRDFLIRYSRTDTMRRFHRNALGFDSLGG